MTWSRQVYLLEVLARQCKTDSAAVGGMEVCSKLNQDRVLTSCDTHVSKDLRQDGVQMQDSGGSTSDYASIAQRNTDDSQQEWIRDIDRTPEKLYQRFLLKPDQPPDACIIRVSILGRPNAGKSTLINSLMGWKVNSVSSKVHTTRRNTNTVMTVDNTQIVFIDTPGIITVKERRKHLCHSNMVSDPEKSLNEVDVVGIIVDAENKYTRNSLHVEVLKALYLHRDVPSFLIINKIDTLRSKKVLLEMTRYLTEGIVGKTKILCNSTLQPKKTSYITKNSMRMFDKLEEKYGKIIHKNKQVSMESRNRAPDKTYNENNVNKEASVNSDTFKEQTNDSTKCNDGNIKDIKNVMDLGIKQNNVCTIDEQISPGQRKFRTVTNEAGLSQDKTDAVENNLTQSSEVANENIYQIADDENSSTVSCNSFQILDESYQSAFLASVMSTHEVSNQSNNKVQSLEKANRDVEKADKIKALEAVSEKTGWPHFDKVFLISALNGSGLQDIKDYLLQIAKPGDWMYHSSVVTDQHPHDLAKIVVWQCLLEHIDGFIPYTLYPEITYWEVNSSNQLNVVMEISAYNKFIQKQILGDRGTNIQIIARDARQALLDAFHCDVRFKVVVVLRKQTRNN